ncbi:hypothetical protein Plec18170_002770 [Paecilomyces lecythidis]
MLSLNLLLAWYFLPAVIVGAPNNNHHEAPPPNSNHIFNTIYASMRHDASSLYPTGVSFFLATVPRGTQFYHGSGSPDPVRGLEWLAFEPEHALGFAHRSEQHGHRHVRGQEGLVKHTADAGRNSAQHPLGSDEPDDSANKTAGYLHTYVTTKDLRLLYLDGMSGTRGHALDAQDRILFNDTIGSEPDRVSETGIGGPPIEQERAMLACKMAKDVWNDRIDGLIRTEADFEIILCNFERDLEVAYITRTRPQSGREYHGKPHWGERFRQQDNHDEERRRPREEKRSRKDKPGAALTKPERKHIPKHKGPRKGRQSRFNNLAGHQVIIDFEHFVTAYTYDLDLFPDNSTSPSLDHIPTEKLEPIREDINNMILTVDPPSHPFNWQSTVDRIKAAYSDVLHRLARGHFRSMTSLREELEHVLEPFIDYRDTGDWASVTYRCQESFIPKYITDDTFVVRVVRHISHEICSAMTLPLADSEIDAKTATKLFHELVEYLAWTSGRKHRRHP